MTVSFDKLTKEELLKRARGHIFSTGMQDSASDLCTENMKYGLAKLHSCQYSLGLAPNATFIAAPDATVTRNLKRWHYGFGYGGKVSWGEGDEKFVYLDAMPNVCGMLVGGIDSIPDTEQLVEGMNELNTQEDTIEGLHIKWDFGESNHFIDLFELKPLSLDYDFPFKYAFIIHGSVPEIKGDNETKFGFGLYYHKSETLRDMAETVETPLGETKILTGDNATKYMDFIRHATVISKKKRLRAAARLFGDYIEITNPVHQGLLNMNEIILGSHNTKDKTTNGLFPMALRADLPAYLLKGHENFDEETIEVLGFNKRAEKYGVKHRLLGANILPHGGGYTFPHLLGLTRIIEASTGTRFFVTEVSSGVDSETIFATPRELQFAYRGRQVVTRTLELGLGTVMARLVPRTVLKI